MKTINTRIGILRALDIPSSWCIKTNHLNPNDRIFITTEKPASEMSVEELEQLIENKKAEAMITKALAQYYEALDILKAFGAEVESEIIGLENIDWLKDKKEE